MEYGGKDAGFQKQEHTKRGRILLWLSHLSERILPAPHAVMTKPDDTDTSKSTPRDAISTHSADAPANGKSASGDQDVSPPASAPTLRETDELLEQLPSDIVDELGLRDENAQRPLKPPDLDFSSADSAPNPASFGNNWRLLAPEDSKAFKEAHTGESSPREGDVAQKDENDQSVLEILLDSMPKRD